ncbi:MAG: TolC family protein [Dysgonamonadaceae bacterium]|jgi:cobalt-zinc-cadmium efflux system outer membrane protein|nr:TolC family protein [Dysgonamonadaceae bacterium]
MRNYIVYFFIIFPFLPCSAQEKQTLKLTCWQVENLFFQQNMLLIAEQMNVDKADASILQAKLWDNPELSVEQINFWGGAEKEKQFSIELSQLFVVARKRSKLVAREKISKEMSVTEMKELIRSLITELRKSVYEMQYLQAFSRTVYNRQQSLEQLIDTYRKQVEAGNMSKNELLRLQSSLLEIENEANELETALNEQQKNIKSLLCLDTYINVEILPDETLFTSPEHLSQADLMEQALQSRPDLEYLQLEKKFHEKSFIYEKSLAVPDITLSANYDRYGGVWKDFVGVGISFNLPFLNRNQGNIRAAKISMQQSEYLFLQKMKVVQHEITEAFDNYCRAYKLYEKTKANEFIFELDNMLETCARNFLNRNISMLEYLDYMEAYKNGMQTVLIADKNLRNCFAELQYVTGNEIKQDNK